jgi:hypothetical protein
MEWWSHKSKPVVEYPNKTDADSEYTTKFAIKLGESVNGHSQKFRHIRCIRISQKPQDLWKKYFAHKVYVILFFCNSCSEHFPSHKYSGSYFPTSTEIYVDLYVTCLILTKAVMCRQNFDKLAV